MIVIGLRNADETSICQDYDDERVVFTGGDVEFRVDLNDAERVLMDFVESPLPLARRIGRRLHIAIQAREYELANAFSFPGESQSRNTLPDEGDE